MQTAVCARCGRNDEQSRDRRRNSEESVEEHGRGCEAERKTSGEDPPDADADRSPNEGESRNGKRAGRRAAARKQRADADVCEVHC